MRFSLSVAALAALAPSAFAFSANIVAVGASITEGVGSTYGNGFRDEIQNTLRASGNTIRMVGTQHNGTMDDNGSEGYPGFQIGAVQNAITQSWPKISPKPNVVVILVGTNNMNADTAAAAPGDLINLVDKIHKDLCKECLIVVSTLPPNRNQAKNDLIKVYNSEIRTKLSAKKDSGEHVRWIEGFFESDNKAFGTETYGDDTHPGDPITSEIGRRFARRIEEAKDWIPALTKRDEEAKIATPFTA